MQYEQESGEQVAVEIETGKSDIKSNLKNIAKGNFDLTVFVATTGDAITACQRAIDSIKGKNIKKIELLSWLDIP